MKMIKKVILLTLCVVLMIVAFREWRGYFNYFRYRSERIQVKSIESGFIGLEEKLKRATVLSNNPLFEKRLARLYLERAFGEIQFGSAESREDYLDLMWESLVRLIQKNPVDAFAYYEMGKCYLLYNFPLVTYFDKAKLYFQKALELKPSDAFLNSNILYIYLTQWDLLDDEGKGFVFKRIGEMSKKSSRFVSRLRSLWRKEAGSPERLKEMLSQNQESWKNISKYF